MQHYKKNLASVAVPQFLTSSIPLGTFGVRQASRFNSIFKKFISIEINWNKCNIEKSWNIFESKVKEHRERAEK